MEISQGSGLEKSRIVLVGALFLMTWLFLQPAGAENAGESGNKRMTVKFKSNCASCHGTDGAGTPLGKSMNAPDLRSADVQKHSDAELAEIIANGKKDMPSFKKSLTEDQIRGLVQYVRELAKNKAPEEK